MRARDRELSDPSTEIERIDMYTTSHTVINIWISSNI